MSFRALRLHLSCPGSVALEDPGPSLTHLVFCLVSRAWHPGSAPSGLSSFLHLVFSLTHPYFSGLLHSDQVLLPERIYVGGLNLMRCQAGLSRRFLPPRPASETTALNPVFPFPLTCFILFPLPPSPTFFSSLFLFFSTFTHSFLCPGRSELLNHSL